MNEHIESLITALRDELQQYGEMLALQEQQQDLVVRRNAAGLLQNLAAINGQTSVMQVARRQRETRQRDLNLHLRLPATATFTELERALPAECRPLVRALVEENNQCLARVQARTRQNHLLLSRSLEMLQRFMAALFPAQMVTTYNQTGQVATAIAGSAGGFSEVAG